MNTKPRKKDKKLHLSDCVEHFFKYCSRSKFFNGLSIIGWYYLQCFLDKQFSWIYDCALLWECT